MGESLSWIAFKGIHKEEVLARLSLRDTGEPDETGEEEYVGTDLADGWYLVRSNDDLTYDSCASKNHEMLSAGCRLVGCGVVESTMASVSFCFENGQDVWHVAHYQHPDENLKIYGTPPEGFDAIRADYTNKQQEDGARDRVDYIFEIPVETAKLVCRYRYDEWEYDWGKPAFAILEPVGAGP